METVESPKEVAQKQRAARKVHAKITMGCVAAILGVSPSMKREQVVRSMVREYHNAPSEYVDNIAAEYNDQMRPTAIMALENQVKRNVIHVDIAKPLYKHMSSHPMTMRSDRYDGPGLVFIRTPFGQRTVTDKSEFKSIDDQPHMYAQMQIEMHLAGCKWGVFFQWSVCAQTAKIIMIDDDFVAQALPQLDAFYEHYKAETKNKDHLEELLPTVDNKKVRDALEEYDELCVSEDNIKTRKAELMEILKTAAKDRSVAFAGGRKLMRVERQGSISYSNAVKKLLPDADLEEYRGNPSIAWTLS